VGTPEELRDRIAGRPVLQVTLKEVTQETIEALRRLKQIAEINVNNSAPMLTITLDDIRSATPEVVRSIVYTGGKVLSVNVLRPSLEEAYLKLVKEE